jgi:sulfate transport system ATP-binding protein
MGLARALAVDPSVLLLDEPFGALDARVRKELRAWLRRLHEETHVTTVIVTHDQEEAMEVADQIALVRQGRLEQVGPPRELYDRPANEFVLGFVGSVNRVGDAYVRPHDVEILLAAAHDAHAATVARIVHLGFDARVELVTSDGERLEAQLTSGEAEELGLVEGQTVFFRSTRPVSLA